VAKTILQYYDQGEKSGKLLAWRIKKIQTDRAINLLTLENGEKIVDPLEINNIFKLYYENLYKSEFGNNLEGQNNFLDNLQFLKLLEGTRSTLERKLSIEELSEALQGMSIGKAPGPDGLPIEIYKTFAGKLLPHLLEMFNESFEKEILPPSLRSALITLILKPGKPPNEKIIL